ncbi:hypothetical protein [Streptomyces geranii]|uniref:hypothetical protein n=1 Tax=Streptomyces geranii TaxID=2058923 RepID=UPI000D037ED8|nr:hypothetical protein [Streptomyces geranii]
MGIVVPVVLLVCILFQSIARLPWPLGLAVIVGVVLACWAWIKWVQGDARRLRRKTIRNQQATARREVESTYRAAVVEMQQHTNSRGPA